MRDDIEKILLNEESLSGIVKEVGAKISEDYRGKRLLMISILKGSVVFMADLMRAITIPCRIDFRAVSSYGSGVKTSGVVKIVKDLDINLEGYDLLIVEDILDSGKTLHYIREILTSRNPKSIRICTLLDKPERRQVDLAADYVGACVPDEFVVGYGLDYDEKYRNLPYVGEVTAYRFNLSSRVLEYQLKGSNEWQKYTVPNANLFVEDIHESVREYNKAHPNAPIKYDMEAGSANSWWVSLLPTALMIVLLIGGLVYMTRRMNQTMTNETNRTMSFGKARVKQVKDEKRKTTFADVAGADEEK